MNERAFLKHRKTRRYIDPAGFGFWYSRIRITIVLLCSIITILLNSSGSLSSAVVLEDRPEHQDRILNRRDFSSAYLPVQNFLMPLFFMANMPLAGANPTKVGVSSTSNTYTDRPPAVRQIKVAAASDWSPYSGRDTSGNGIGPAYDLIKKIVEPMGIRVVIEESRPWKRYVAEIKDGSLDIMLTAYKVDPFGIYSEHYAVDEVKVFVKPGKEFPFNGIRDLSDKIGVQPKGAAYDVTFSQRVPGTEYTMRENADAKRCIEMVLDGDGDYYVSSYYDVLEKLKASGYENRLVDLEKPIYVEHVVMVVSEKSFIIDHLSEINDKIIQFREDGTVKRMIEDYAK